MKISSKKWSSFTRKYISLRFLSTKFTPSRKTRKFYILNFLNVWNNSIKWLSLKKIYWNGENIISSLFDRSSLPVYVTSYNENSKSFFVNSFSSFICSNVKFSNISLEQIPDFSRTKNMIHVFYTSYAACPVCRPQLWNASKHPSDFGKMCSTCQSWFS